MVVTVINERVMTGLQGKECDLHFIKIYQYITGYDSRRY